jgi:hypothetical protein
MPDERGLGNPLKVKVKVMEQVNTSFTPDVRSRRSGVALCLSE